MSKPVCLVTGVGPGTGSAICRRFETGGYNVAMLARDADRLDALAQELPGGHPYVCDVSSEDAVKETVAKIKSDLGSPDVVIHNAVRGTRGTVLEISPRDLQRNFEVNVLGLLYLTQATAPSMIEKGKGSILVTGNTAARRGKDFFAAFAPTKAGQRILCESMARDLGPKGVHVAFIMIDAVIDVPWTREAFAGQPDDFYIKPSAIADEAWHLAHQDKSSWAFEVEIRPFGENW